MALPKLSVLLCSYNRQRNVTRCLRALSAQTLPRDEYEVICVNDGSTDGTGEAMKAALSEVPGQYIEHEKNRALAAGRNTAIRASRGKYVVFINDDTYPEPDFLKEHLAIHERYNDPHLAILGFLPFVPELRHRVFSRILMEHDLYFNFAKLEPGMTYPYWYFVTGNLSVPRFWFAEHHCWFDESFLRYGFEDIECGYRLYRRGVRVLYHAAAVCQHEHRIAIDDYLKRAVDNGTNILQFVAKHPDQIIASTILNVPRVTDTIIERWKTELSQLAPHVESTTAQIRKVQDQQLVPGANPGLDENGILKEVASAVRSLGDYMKYKTFVEVLEQYPELRRYLASADWLERSQRLYRRSEISEQPYHMA